MISEDYHYDRLWDRICDEEEEARAAEEMGMTLEQFRAHCENEAGEAAISNFEWSRDE